MFRVFFIKSVLSSCYDPFDGDTFTTNKITTKTKETVNKMNFIRFEHFQ